MGRLSATECTYLPTCLLAQFSRNPHEAAMFTGIRLVPIFVAMLSSLFLLRLHLGTGRRPRVLLPSRRLRIGPPWCRVGVSPGPVLVLVLVLSVRVSASGTFALLLAFAFALSLGLPLALLAIALAFPASTAILGLAFQLGEQALLVVALILVVLALATEGTGDGATVVVGHLGLSTAVGLLLPALDHKALVLVAVLGMHEAGLLVSGVTPQQVLYKGSWRISKGCALSLPSQEWINVDTE